MTAFLAWLVNTGWPAVWGNLAANVLWLPVAFAGGFLASHLAVWRHMRGLHARMDREQEHTHAKLNELVRRISPQVTTTTGGAANVQGESP